MTVPADVVKQHIAQAIDVALRRVRERADELFTSELNSTGNGTASPFQKLLFPEAKVFSSFERSLSASLGKSFDYIGAAVAKATYGNGEHDFKLRGLVSPDALAEIELILIEYKQRIGKNPNTAAEINRIAAAEAKGAAKIERQIKSDVYFIDHEGIKNYLEIKTATPNYDQCYAMKARILTIYAFDLNDVEKTRALSVFPHNPNGAFGGYAWPPLRYFLDFERDWKARDMKLMGAGLWNFIGNSLDTYDELMECFYEVSLDKKQELLSLMKLAEG